MTLTRQTLRTLTNDELRLIAGGPVPQLRLRLLSIGPPRTRLDHQR